ncbi:MAG: hypothetical protein WA941_16810 [Nitrososphaeraceae archaeon]
MIAKSTRNVSSLVDTNVLLDVPGNETRRRILNLISHEPMYFNQLANLTSGTYLEFGSNI